jgi:hypothetical protein
LDSLKQLLSSLTTEESHEASDAASVLNSLVEENAPNVAVLLSKIVFEEFNSFENTRTAIVILSSIIERCEATHDVFKSLFIEAKTHENLLEIYPNEFSHLVSVLFSFCNEEEAQHIYQIIDTTTNYLFKILVIEEISYKNDCFDFLRFLQHIYHILEQQKELTKFCHSALINIVSLFLAEANIAPFIELFLSEFSSASLVTIAKIGKYIPEAVLENIERIWNLICSNFLDSICIENIFAMYKFFSFLYKKDQRITFDAIPLFSFLVNAFCSENSDEPDSNETMTVRQITSEAIDSLISIVEEIDGFLSFIETNAAVNDQNIREICLVVTDALIIHHRSDITDFALQISLSTLESESIRLKIASCWTIHTVGLLYGVDGLDFDCSAFIEPILSLLNEDASLSSVAYECLIIFIKYSHVDTSELFPVISSMFPIEDLVVELQSVRTIEEIIDKEQDPRLISELICPVLELPINREYTCRIISKSLEKLCDSAQEFTDELFQYLSSLEVDEGVLCLITDLFIYSKKIISFDTFFSNITKNEEIFDTSINYLKKLSKVFDISLIMPQLLQTYSECPRESVLELILSIQDKNQSSINCYIDDLLTVLSVTETSGINEVISFLGDLSLGLVPEHSAKVVSFGVYLMNETSLWDQEVINNFLSANEETTQCLSKEFGFEYK